MRRLLVGLMVAGLGMLAACETEELPGGQRRAVRAEPLTSSTEHEMLGSEVTSAVPLVVVEGATRKGEPPKVYTILGQIQTTQPATAPATAPATMPATRPAVRSTGDEWTRPAPASRGTEEK